MTALYQQRTVDPVNSNELIFIHPLAYKRDGSARACIYCHGGGNDETESINPLGDAYRGAAAIASAGYPVVAGDLGGPWTWGNDSAVTQVGQCMDFARTAKVGAKTGKVFLSGLSMGGLAALTAAADLGSANVAGVILFIFDAFLAWSHDTFQSGSQAASINTAYGGLSAYTAAVPTHDPSSYGPVSLAGIPILAFYSTDETDDLSTQQAAFLATMSSHTSVTAYPTTGGHTLTGKDFSPIKAWMDALA